jgi:hypothetical protein
MQARGDLQGPGVSRGRGVQGRGGARPEGQRRRRSVWLLCCWRRCVCVRVWKSRREQRSGREKKLGLRLGFELGQLGFFF